MNPSSFTKFVMMVVLDGWGLAPEGPGNAITLANTQNIRGFWASYPHTQLGASGESVGLPRGEVGNTETGHLNLGAGKIIYQDLARINMSIADGSFFENEVLLSAFNHAQKNNSNLHLMGLIGAGGVHSNIEHLFALIQLANRQKFTKVYLHLFTDGRDSPPTAAGSYIAKIREVIRREGIGTIASIMGRYWAMDRDRRWERTQKAYFALTRGEGHLIKTPEEAIQISYAAGKTDEFVDPCLIIELSGKPVGLIKENDAVVFFNFRIDRPRQLSRAFVLDDFAKASVDIGFDPYLVKYEKRHTLEPIITPKLFERGPRIKNLFFVTMTEYSKDIKSDGAEVAFPPEIVHFPLGAVIAENNLKQLRVSESEKERFVTFYFNGQQETAFQFEDRLIIPSPKVATYDKSPQMSAITMTETLLERLKVNNLYSFILINYANADMVGHTGNLGAAINACSTVDQCVGKLADYVLSRDGVMFIVADHGNAEEMVNFQTGAINTEHSSNPVPFIAINKKFIGKNEMLRAGILADVAPTILRCLDIQVPSSMMGRNLLEGQF